MWKEMIVCECSFFTIFYRALHCVVKTAAASLTTDTQSKETAKKLSERREKNA